MDLYTSVSRRVAREVIGAYSTSFGIASRLFSPDIKSPISDIYALVRIADEIVDTYTGEHARQYLDELEQEVLRANSSGYSSNLVVHAFAATAREFHIDHQLISPFFASMRMDLEPVTKYDQESYARYIYGSAEVVGLMCLNVFVPDADRYLELEPGARALGAAFQKINFLRDMADDYHRLHRFYFPNCTFDLFDDTALRTVVTDIESDLVTARHACRQLPRSSQYAVGLALRYFELLLIQLAQCPVSLIKQQRVRVSSGRKLLLYLQLTARQYSGVPAV